jgi:hypothetical protein
MNRFLTTRRIGILFFGLFAILVTGMLVVQRFWIDPEKQCIKTGRWWYEAGRECVQPIYLPDITQRPAGVTRAEASAQQNRELVAIEDRLKLERAARAAAIVRDREAYEAKRPQN